MALSACSDKVHTSNLVTSPNPDGKVVRDISGYALAVGRDGIEGENLKTTEDGKLVL